MMPQAIPRERLKAINFKANLRGLLVARETGVLLALLGMCEFLSLTTESFLAVRNLLNVGRQVSVLGIMAVGMTFVLVSRGLALSVGSTYAFPRLITGLLSV